MVGVEAALEIRVLHRHGKSIREIARETGVARNTVRRYLRDEEAARYKPRPPRSTKLDPFKAYVAERLGSAVNAAPVFHIAYRITANLRATATTAFVRSHDQACERPGSTGDQGGLFARATMQAGPEPLTPTRTLQAINKVHMKTLLPEGSRPTQLPPRVVAHKNVRLATTLPAPGVK